MQFNVSQDTAECIAKNQRSNEKRIKEPAVSVCGSLMCISLNEH